MRVLFIGGTGTISSACSQLAVERGIDLYLLNRRRSNQLIPAGAHVLQGDIRDPASVDAALGDRTFDVVADWVSYVPEHVEADIARFRGRTGQYIFISSASAYQKPLSGLPITESTMLDNPYWAYSRNKIACEERLVRAYREHQFPITIVRPSHTYSPWSLPTHGAYTDIARMRQGKPAIVHGDGSSLWVLTHHRDFAKGFVGLLGNSHAIGEAYHITSDELLTWNQIYTLLAHAAGVEPHLVHVPSDLIAAYDPNWGAGLLGDKAYSVTFDNAKIKRLVPDFAATIPFARGAKEMIGWYDQHPSAQTVDPQFDQLTDRILAAYGTAWPG